MRYLRVNITSTCIHICRSDAEGSANGIPLSKCSMCSHGVCQSRRLSHKECGLRRMLLVMETPVLIDVCIRMMNYDSPSHLFVTCSPKTRELVACLSQSAGPCEWWILTELVFQKMAQSQIRRYD